MNEQCNHLVQIPYSEYHSSEYHCNCTTLDDNQIYKTPLQRKNDQIKELKLKYKQLENSYILLQDRYKNLELENFELLDKITSYERPDTTSQHLISPLNERFNDLYGFLTASDFKSDFQPLTPPISSSSESSIGLALNGSHTILKQYLPPNNCYKRNDIRGKTTPGNLCDSTSNLNLGHVTPTPKLTKNAKTVSTNNLSLSKYRHSFRETKVTSSKNIGITSYQTHMPKMDKTFTTTDKKEPIKPYKPKNAAGLEVAVNKKLNENVCLGDKLSQLHQYVVRAFEDFSISYDKTMFEKEQLTIKLSFLRDVVYHLLRDLINHTTHSKNDGISNQKGITNDIGKNGNVECGFTNQNITPKTNTQSTPMFCSKSTIDSHLNALQAILHLDEARFKTLKKLVSSKF